MAQGLTGWGSGLIGVMIFSGSLPATRVAVVDFTPVFLTSARAAIAAALGAILLATFSQARPGWRDLPPLAIVALGVVIGFPLLTALALRTSTASHATVFIGLLPLATALFGVLRGEDRPGRSFWAFSGFGAAAIAAFAFQDGGRGTLESSLLMLAAIAVCGLGYAEGAKLSQHLGGWQVISWALILSLPVTVTLAWSAWPESVASVSHGGWIALGYVAVFSMLVGFVFWYRGLATGGVAGVAQLQLLQPFLGLLLAGLLLGEQVTWPMVGCTALVVVCVAGASRHV